MENYDRLIKSNFDYEWENAHESYESIINKKDTKINLKLQNLGVGKNKKGKTEGARFLFLDIIVKLAISPHNKNIFEFCSCFNEIVYKKKEDILSYDYRKLFKILFSQIEKPVEFINSLIKVRNYALDNSKYSSLSYQSSIDLDDLHDAIARHLIKYLFVCEIDEETGESHLAHIATNLIICAGQIK